jgi:hypothetical protein
VEVAIHYSVSPEKVQLQGEVILMASADTVEAIDRLASDMKWPREYSFSVPHMQNGKLFIKYSILLPTELAGNFREIFVRINDLYRAHGSGMGESDLNCMPSSEEVGTTTED